MINLFNGDCLEEMKKLKDNSVDLVLTDPPYGTTACKWDSVIDFNLMWKELNRVTKENTAILIFGAEPYSSFLRCSNIKNFKYDWVWDKINKKTGFLNSKRQPLRIVENISVFYRKQCNYYPIMTKGVPYTAKSSGGKTENYGKQKDKIVTVNNGLYYPTQLVSIKGDCKKEGLLHSTQKCTELLEYLIRTYTLENETVLDFTMGSGSTGVAAKNLNRKFIGIEKDELYFRIAKARIDGNGELLEQLKLERKGRK